MSAVEFEYLRWKGMREPMVPIELLGKHGWVRILAYVDSGATRSTFEAREVEALGLNLRAGRKVFSMVGDGTRIRSYVHPVRARIGNVEFLARIGFSKDINVGFSILGRESVFDQFRICFDELAGVITFEPKGV